ncbi:MAG TPA: hypothetical protein VGS57_02865 [Thermoanaerobaculia bacterium]|jgi:hypothetical protein|nr:hypothetical protein [Thermoanaerobaculia bacterium]
MRPRIISSVFAPLAAALLLGACGSGGIGDIINGPNGSYPSQIKGIVRTVDTRSGDCRIDLDNVSNSTYLNNGNNGSYGGGYGNGNRATVYCDNQTRVVYQGNSYRPESLESGDEVVADVRDVNGRLVAERIDVTYDVSSNDRYGNDRNGNDRYGNNDPYARSPYPQQDDRYGTYGSVGNEDVRGVVQRVDTQNRTVTLERVQYYDRNLARGGDLLTLYFDNDTHVTFRNQSYRPENLERGDVVAIDVDQVRGTLVANDIRVLSDARENSASYPPR